MKGQGDWWARPPEYGSVGPDAEYTAFQQKNAGLMLEAVMEVRPMRYFTDEELLKESRPLADLALEALEAGQVQHLHYLLNEMDQGHAGLCGLGLQWLPRMWGKIRSEFGEDVLDGMLGKSAAYLMEPYVEEFLRRG